MWVGIKAMMKKEIEIPKIIKINALIIYYLLQVLFILMYSETTMQPFVYVRF